MQILLLFLLVPLIEIALFIQVGGLIGLWPTLAIVVLTAFAGAYLVRQQGLSVLQNIQQSFGQLEDPTEPLVHGAMILFSGALLLTPGFFTDAVGFALLVPNIRKAVFQFFRSRVKTTTFSMHTAHGHQGRSGVAPNVIDGDFTEVGPRETRADTSPPDPQERHPTRH